MQWFSAINVAAVTAFFWILMLFAIVKFQIIDDGTRQSMLLVGGSALVLFVGTGKRISSIKRYTANS